MCSPAPQRSHGFPRLSDDGACAGMKVVVGGEGMDGLTPPPLLTTMTNMGERGATDLRATGFATQHAPLYRRCVGGEERRKERPDELDCGSILRNWRDGEMRSACGAMRAASAAGGREKRGMRRGLGFGTSGWVEGATYKVSKGYVKK